MPEFFESLPPAELWISFRSISSDEFRASEGRHDGWKNEQLAGFEYSFLPSLLLSLSFFFLTSSFLMALVGKLVS